MDVRTWTKVEHSVKEEYEYVWAFDNNREVGAIVRKTHAGNWAVIVDGVVGDKYDSAPFTIMATIEEAKIAAIATLAKMWPDP